MFDINSDGVLCRRATYHLRSNDYYSSRNYASRLVRLPLDGSAPSALGVAGSPVDQFSFLQSEDRHLNVLMRADADGDARWAAEGSRGDAALLRVPLTAFADGADDAPASSYRELPTPSGYAFQNRFVGDYLIYGTGAGWDTPQTRRDSRVYATRWATEDRTHELPLAHGVDRIEALGRHAVIVGGDRRDLHFTPLRLAGVREPEVVPGYVRRGAAQGETRSHGFFYKPEDADSGILGLPVRGAGRVARRA